MTTTLAAAIEALLGVLDRMEIPYFVGGSIASSIHGMPRQTNDVDIVADFSGADVVEFCQLLESEFYVDVRFAREAIDSGRSFNAIHLKGAFKFDFFPANQDAFAQSQLSRRRYFASAIPGLENIEFPISSPEDSVLSKLVWFRKGGEVSDRQWHDILGVISVQAGRLDRAYLVDQAKRLDVADLLDKAVRESQ